MNKSQSTALKQMENKNGVAEYVRYGHEIAFSIYFPLLLITVNDYTSLPISHGGGYSWVYSLCRVISDNRYARSHEETALLHFALALLWAVSATVLFLCLRMLARLSFAEVFPRTIAGIVAVAGFPLASGYVTFRGYLHMLGSFPRALLYVYAPHRWLAVEVMASLVCVFLYVFRRWPVKAMWSLLLLVVHFAIWTVLLLMGGGTGRILLHLPLLGFLASLCWGLYVQESTKARGQLNSFRAGGA